jgi:hypothetical protein
VLFLGVAATQLIGIIWAANASGAALVVALAVTMAAIYGQVTVTDVVIARYTADAWRGRVYAVRYFLTFVSSGLAVSAIALMHLRGGFDLVLVSLAGIAGLMVLAVGAFAFIAAGIQTRPQAIQPAE